MIQDSSISADVFAGAARIIWAGETLTLLPERALWWEREKSLFITDPHFGKASTFRYVGIAVPESTHDADLTRLDHVLQKTHAKRLIILGDFFHAKIGRSESVIAALSAWRSKHPELEIDLILGNHDRHAGAPPEEWNITCHANTLQTSPFLCCHEPQNREDTFVLAGHLHPSFSLRTRSSRLRSPCFHFTNHLCVLPAFGEFTGTHPITATDQDRVFIVGPSEVIDVSIGLRVAIT